MWRSRGGVSQKQMPAPQGESSLNEDSSSGTPSRKAYIYCHRSPTLPCFDRVSHYSVHKKPGAEEIPGNPQG